MTTGYAVGAMWALIASAEFNGCFLEGAQYSCVVSGAAALVLVLVRAVGDVLSGDFS